MRLNSFMSWIGGKKALRELIVTLFPVYYERYIEVFGGGGWVLFHKPPGNDFEVYNDFNSLLVNLYRCVRDKPQELMEALRYVLNSREDFDVVRATLARDSPASDVQKAAWFYELIRYSYAAGLTSFGSQPHDMWSNFPLIEQAHRRLAKVVIENKDFEKLIRQYVALCGTAEHAMLWMLEQNPKLQKIILCLDHDAAGIEAAGRLTDILCKHGYTQSAPLRSTNKDWDEDLKEQHGLEPQPPEEHPQLIVAGTICERIGAKCKAVRPEQASYQIPRLLQQYQNDLHWGRFEQAMDHMETMSALALSVVLRECRQMGTVLTEEQGARFLQSHIHPHQNRGSLKTRATEIGMEFQSVLAKDAVEGIRTEVEKKATASAWLELAISCAKVPIKYCADELRRQQKEEKALLEAAQAMASY